MDVTYSFQVDATLVANEFIDRYMADANGEYVKVYLYLLRHRDEPFDLEKIAEQLNHTEADVRRALAYWEKLGAIKKSGTEAPPAQSADAAPGVVQAAVSRPAYTREQVERLQGDGEFSQLLYIAQRYLGKIFTQREFEVFAYLYDGLSMSAELLEYLVEHCVQGGHTSIRYIETVALNWHERGFKTVEEAKAYTSGFTKNSFSVMRAFGLTGRNPGEAEQELIGRWFNEYGFTREVVQEACRRTLEATHNPSFRYADKILSEWRKAGVKSLADVSALDEKRREQKTQNRKSRQAVKPKPNQFHNFEQRDTDYDSIVLQQVKGWIGEQ